jgi:hypothetical protein
VAFAGVVTKVGSRVRFSMRSVFLPDPGEAATFASGLDELEGTIAGLSDSGGAANVYAVVEVTRKMSFVVPVADLSLLSGPDTYKPARDGEDA